MSRIKPSPFLFNKSLLVSSEPKNKYGCLMALLPEYVTRQVDDWRSRINPSHMGPGGIEDEAHITIKYGFDNDDDRDEILDILRANGPFSVRLKNTSLFRGNDDGDVYKVDVESSDLRRLNKLVSETFSCTDTYPEYKPHLTIAYLDPNFSNSYLSQHPPFINTDVLITEVVYSTADRRKTRISLTEQGKAMSWLNNNAGGALVGKRKLRKGLIATWYEMKGGFTGKKRDRAGRTMCYSEGMRVPCGQGGQGKVNAAGGGEQPQQQGRGKKPKQKPDQDDYEYSTVEGAIAKLGQMKQDVNIGPDSAKELANYIMGLTNDQIRELKKKLQVRASGAVAVKATKIADRALENVRMQLEAETAPEGQQGVQNPKVGKTPLRKPGFTGKIKDKRGRTICYRDGYRVSCGELEEVQAEETKPEEEETQNERGTEEQPAEEGRREEQSAEQRGSGVGEGGEGVRGENEEGGGAVEEEAARPVGSGTNQEGNAEGKPAGTPAPHRVPARLDEVNKRMDRFERFFNAKGQHRVVEWMGKLRESINAMGGEEALKALASSSETGNRDQDVQYWGVGTEEANWKNMGDFMEAYLARNGVIAVTGDTSEEGSPLISALGKPDRYLEGDFKPTNDAFKNKLDEAKHLPGLEKSEDLSVLMGGERPKNFTKELVDKLNERYGEGKWIVKCYDDNAAAGYGIFFPQRVMAIQQDARNTIWQAGENLARYGFSLDRDKDNKITGIKHQNGDVYEFGSDKFNNTIFGDARHWADRASAASQNENGALFPEGSFMAQPAFEAVGISDAERAAGKTWHESNEGRVHLVTRADGSVSVVPHATWLKGGSLPVVFENEDTRAMAKAAQDAINQLPLEARKGQVYAPDVMKTPDGYKVVELNAQGDYNGSGYLHDNHFTIDAYVSHLTGRVPAHVAFIRKLLTSREKEKAEKAFRRHWYMKSLQLRAKYKSFAR